MSLPSFSAYCQQDPAAFYLGHPRGGEFVSLADAVVATGNRPAVELPVHSHTLAQHSAVLRSVFAAQAGGDLAAPKKVGRGTPLDPSAGRGAAKMPGVAARRNMHQLLGWQSSLGGLHSLQSYPC